MNDRRCQNFSIEYNGKSTTYVLFRYPVKYLGAFGSKLNPDAEIFPFPGRPQGTLFHHDLLYVLATKKDLLRKTIGFRSMFTRLPYRNLLRDSIETVRDNKTKLKSGIVLF